MLVVHLWNDAQIDERSLAKSFLRQDKVGNANGNHYQLHCNVYALLKRKDEVILSSENINGSA